MPGRAISSNRAASTPDLATAWMAVAKSGVPQPEAALKARLRLATSCCHRFIGNRMRPSMTILRCETGHARRRAKPATRVSRAQPMGDALRAEGESV
jgi:hypothetical protein